MTTVKPSTVKTIILVDDEEDVLNSLERDLGPWTNRRGLTVLTADSAEECLRIMESEYPETGLVVSDLRMPGMNGADLFQKLGRDYPDVGCVMVTAYSDMDQIKRAVSGSMLGLVQKPWDAGRLSEELEQAIDHVEERRYADKRTWELSTELELAGAFQRACMKVPHIDDPRVTFSVLSRPTPGLEVTGDFFDIERIGRDRYLVLVGDVAGHGVRASLLSGMLTVIARSFVQSTDTRTLDPAMLLEQMNHGIFEFLPNESDMLVSCIVALVDLEEGNVSVANAGHPPMFIVRDNSYADSTTLGVALGALQNIEYHNENFPVTPGDRIVLYTDGLYERRQAESTFSRKWIGRVFFAADRNPDFENQVINYVTGERMIRGDSTLPLFEDDVTIASLRING